MKTTYSFRTVIDSIRRLRGDPHYISMGMAVGVFVGVTPTFPFHTAFAVSLAALLRGSKRAAAVAVWFANPVTMPLFYLGSYKTGTWLLGVAPAPAGHTLSILETGAELAFALIAGGAVLGIAPAIAAYAATYAVMKKRRAACSFLRTPTPRPPAPAP